MLIKVTFIKKCLFGAKGEERLVTERSATQYEKLGLIEKLSVEEKEVEHVNPDGWKAEDTSLEKQEKSEPETKEEKQEFETKGEKPKKAVKKEEKPKAKITKAPRL